MARDGFETPKGGVGDFEVWHCGSCHYEVRHEGLILDVKSNLSNAFSYANWCSDLEKSGDIHGVLADLVHEAARRFAAQSAATYLKTSKHRI